MKKKLLFIAFVFFISIINVNAQASNIDKNITILKKGVHYYEQKEYQKAEAQFLQIKIIESHTDNINKSINFLYNLWLGKTYIKLNKFNNAKNYLDTAFLICKIIYSTKDEIYLSCLESLINANLKIGNNVQSIELLLQKRGILTELNKVLSYEFAINETTLGDCYNVREDFVNSENFYKSSILIFEKINEIENDDYSLALHNLASLYSKIANYKMATSYFLEAATVLNKIRGKDNNDYCYLLINLANVYSASNSFLQADSLYLEGLEILKKIVGKIHPDYFMALNAYANFFEQIQDYQKADSIYRNVISTIEENLGVENSEYLSALKGLGRFYILKGNYKEAKIKILQALNLSKKLYSDSNYRYAQVLLDLGRINEFEGDNFTADSIYNKVLHIYKGTFNENHPAYGIVLGNLSRLYVSIGEVSKAEENYKKELNIYKINNQNRMYAITLGFYSKFLLQKKEYKNSENILLEAKLIQENILGKTSLDYANTLTFLSALYDKMGKYNDALNSAEEASNICEKILGEKYIDYNGALTLISIANFRLGNYELASKIQKKAIELNENILGYDNLELVTSLINLSKYYVTAKNYDSAINVLKKSNVILNNYFNSRFFTSTNAYQKNLLFSILPKIESLSSIFFLINNYRSPVNGLHYDNELLYKGVILRNSEKLSRFIKNSGDEILIKDFDSLRLLKDQILEYKLKRNIRNSINYSEKETLAESKERILVKHLSKYGYIGEKKLNTSWIDVQNKLTKNDVAIEFVNFKYKSQYNSDSTLYGALVLRPSYKEPKFVYLFEQRQLDSIIKKQHNISDSSYLNQLYQYGFSGKKLHELIWKPIDSLLQGAKMVFVAPSGILHTINLSALPISNNLRVGDSYNLKIVGSTGEILSNNEQYLNDLSINKAWLFGGIDYNNVRFTVPKLDTNNEFNYSVSRNSSTQSGIEKWDYLLNTLYEVTSIDSLCRKNNINTSFVSGNMASKTVFKNISGETKPFILHLATHGFFFPDNKNKAEELNVIPLDIRKNIIKMSDNPLLRSGLIFSGANKTWSSLNYQSDTTDDGILTALEISNLDLSEAKLVVMSACETGLGDIKGSEGVFGLQRAFKLAGAKKIIMSLWKVPDAQTKELMKLFYQKCFTGFSISDALKSAQTEMGKKYPPYYWAAFKLLE